MARNEQTTIWVYADWASLKGPQLMGLLSADRVRGKEVFSFAYEEDWLKGDYPIFFLDPALSNYKGQQFLSEGRSNFGLFLDSSPDRWGRLLMRRKEALLARIESRNERTLFESDYLLGVFDGHRLGGLRFKLDPDGVFQNDDKKMSTPPWVSLRELEYASLQLEREDALQDPEYAKWLNMLIDPGSSLGGARPKATVKDENGHLWMAKFPSGSDDKNIGAWEMVLHELAADSGIQVPEAKLLQLSGKHHTYLSKRFDRTSTQERLHYASAMTLLGYQDGDGFQEGASYLDLVAFLLQQGASVTADLEQLWRRVVFNILVSNTDDHLRNHGFILTDQGWILSPAFDMNPNETVNGLAISIVGHNNEQDLSLALDTAKHYKLSGTRATSIVTEIKQAIAAWKSVAKRLGISSKEIEQMKRAFRLV